MSSEYRYGNAESNLRRITPNPSRPTTRPGTRPFLGNDPSLRKTPRAARSDYIAPSADHGRRPRPSNAAAGCQFSDNFYPNINPDNMQNNCTVVAAAHMTCHASANDLWMNTYGRPLPDKPLNTAQVDRLLSYTGQKYKMDTFEASGNNTAYQNMIGHLPPGPAKVGVALYQRTNGSGHAVNMYDQRQGVSTAIGLPRGLFFHDFQHNDAGAVCTEIKRAEKIHTFLPDMANLNADSIREEKARSLGPPGREWWFSRNE